MTQMSESLPEYVDLGFLSSAPPDRSIVLSCDKCCVQWTGCQDASECPKCGDSEGWANYMRGLQ